MNGTLYVLAQAAAPAVDATPDNPLASLLGGVLPVLAGAVIGYVLGILRDASKAKTDREARHQDQVLEAATGLLETAARAKELGTRLATKGRALAKAEVDYPRLAGRMQAEHVRLRDDFTAERDRFHEAVDAIQPHALRLDILAPSMVLLVDKIAATASDLRHDSPGERSELIRASYDKARQMFTALVRDYLKVKP